jgi:uncharacterized surface protein with fasciclin (FAS1) repeats
MHLNCLIALLTFATAASASSTTPSTSRKAILNKGNGSLYGFISMPNNKYETAQFNRLLKSDPGYQPIIDLLNNTGALTAFIPNDKAIQFFLDRQAPDLQKGQYPPPTAIINNVTMLDVLKQHITTGRYATTSNNYPAMVKSSILTNETIDHLGFGSPVLIDTNSTYTNFSDKNWRVQNAGNIQWNVGNGWLSADVVQRDVPTNNGYLNVIDGGKFILLTSILYVHLIILIHQTKFFSLPPALGIQSITTVRYPRLIITSTLMIKLAVILMVLIM